MKKYLGMVCLFLLGLASCKKDHDAAKQAKEDDAAIQAYIEKNKIDAIKHESGLYYQIIAPGEGANPGGTSVVEVKYVGHLLNGSVFDQTKDNTVKFPLNRVIPGWTIGIPLVKPGGKIKLLLPSALGYGNTSPGAGIPKNAVLIFDVDLIAVQ